MRLRAILFCAAFATALPSTAHALNTRTWVSGKGVDQAGCGPVGAPCRSLQYAHDQTSSGGEIDILDPAGYGAITITKSISIINDGVGVAGVLASAGGSAVTINAGATDSIALRGLTVEGSKTGVNGVVFVNGQYLTISNCVIQGFVTTTSDGTTGNGVYIRVPNSQYSGVNKVTISNTTVSNNGGMGVYGTASSGGGSGPTIVVDASTVLSNGAGIVFSAIPGAVTNTIASQNVGPGFVASGASTVNVDQLVASNNGTYGVYVQPNVYLWISRSVMFGNDTGVRIDSGAFVSSYGDNRVNQNFTADRAGLLLSGGTASQ